MALLPLFQIQDATIMQWQTRWKSILDNLLIAALKDANGNIITNSPSVVIGDSSGPLQTVLSSTPLPFTVTPSVSISTTSPVLISIQPGPALVGNSFFKIDIPFLVHITVYRGTTPIFVFSYVDRDSSGGGSSEIPPSVTYVDNPPPGTYTYSSAVTVVDIPPGEFQFQNVQMALVRLGS